VIDLTEENGHAVAPMLRLMYTRNYNDGKSADSDLFLDFASRSAFRALLTGAEPFLSDPQNMAPYKKMIRAAQVYALVDMYDIPGLRNFVVAKFTLIGKENWPDALNAALAIVEVIYKTMPTSDKGLRNITIEACAPHVGKILVTALCGEFMEEHGDF